MYKSKNNNILKNISKFVSWCMAMFLIISVSFAGELNIVPLNILDKRVDSTTKSIEISQAQGKAVVKNLYTNNLKQVNLLKANPMLEAVKMTTSALNDRYLCNIKDNDTTNILYKSNDDFRKQIKNLASDFSMPQKEDMVDSCGKLMSCVLQTNDSQKIIDSVQYCQSIVNDYYIDQYKNSYNLSSLSQANKGSDAFRNNTLSDSSYDILNDVYILAKILFDSAEEPTEILFYDMPNVGPVQEDPFLLMATDRYSPYYTPSNNDGNPSGNGGGGGNGNGGDGEGDDNPPPVQGELDDEIVEFTQTITHEVEGQEGYDFLGSDCVDGFTIQGYDGYSYTQTITGTISGNSMTPAEYQSNIVSDIENFLCEYDENCDPSPGEGGPDSGDPSGNGGDGYGSGLDEKTKQCLQSCSDVPCTATNCDRLACYAKCLCVNYESPFFDPIENPGLGTVFKLKLCILPVQDHKVSTSKKVYTLESIVSSINIVIQDLRNSGELMLNKKTKEFLDAGFQNNDFSKQISFSIDGYEKVPESKGSEKQEKEDQINTNTSLMENILGFEKEETANGKGRNKYIIKGGTIEEGTVVNTQQSNAPQYEPVENDMDIVGSLQTSHLNNMGSEVYDFLQGNLDFRQSLKEIMVSIKTTANSLYNKK